MVCSPVIMPRLPSELDEPRGEAGATASEESAAPPTEESPSLAFLRDLARVSEHAPGAFEAQLALAGEAASPDDAAFPAAARFQVRRRLGAGGFGVVYEAFDRERNAAVALKAQRRRDGRSIGRFKNEFRSLVELAHENLVQLYELHAEGDAWFFTMELVDGETLEELPHLAGWPTQGGHTHAPRSKGASPRRLGVFDGSRNGSADQRHPCRLSGAHRATP